MWKYTPTEELYHFGIPGMKWGRRKAKPLPVSNIRSNYDRTKEAYQKAKKQYSRDFNKSSTLFGAWGPGNQARHDKTYNSALKANRAEAAYKKAKAVRKEAIKNQYHKIQKNATFKDKLLLNNAGRKAIAKYMVDNNMPMSEAKKKVNKEAVRNTILSIGASALYGGAVAYYLNKHL